MYYDITAGSIEKVSPVSEFI